MSNENHPENIIPTATVAIFSPDMWRILLVFNDRLMAFVPPGGKQKPEDNWDIVATAFREVQEETGVDLHTLHWEWLDVSGNVVSGPTVVQEESFDLERKQYQDFLFFFRLVGDYQETYQAEKIAEWYTRKTVIRPSVVIGGRASKVLVEGIRKNILAVMT